MRRLVGVLAGGWILLLGLLFYWSLSGLRTPAEKPVGADAQFPSSQSANAGSDANTALTFQEDFTSYQALAYTEETDWNIARHQLSLARQDNIGQREVVVVSASSAEGNPVFYLVWQDLRNDEGDIYLQKLDAQGNRLWEQDRRVNCDDGAATQSTPAAVADSVGNLLIAWVDDRNGNQDIYAQRVNPQGETSWVEDLRIHDETGLADQGAPVVATAGNGQTFVAWHDNREGDYNVYLQQVDENGTRQWATDKRVNQDASHTVQTDPIATIEPGGSLSLAWLDRRVGNGDIYLQRFSPAGAPLWAQEVRINQPAEQTANRAALAHLPNGTVVVSWLDPVDNHIYLQAVDQQGIRRWPQTIRANQPDQPANAERAPAVAPLGNGLLVTWERANDRAIYGQSISEQGTLQWSGDQHMITERGVVAANGGEIGLAATPDQRVLLAWSDQRQHESGNIYVQLIDSQGQRVWPCDVRVNEVAGSADQILADATSTAAGLRTLVWQDWRAGGVSQLYIQRVQPDGQLLWTKPIPVQRMAGTPAAQLAPKLANLADDTFVAWADMDGDVTRIALQRLDAAGNRLWPVPRRIDANGAPQNNPALAVNAAGDLFIAWETTQASTTQIALVRLNAQGEPQWPQPLTLSGGNGSSRLPELAVDQQGHVYVTWLTTSAEGANLYLHKLNANGQASWSAPLLVNSAQGLVNLFNRPALATTDAGDSMVVWVDNRQSDLLAQRIDPAGNKQWVKDLRLNTTIGTYSPMPSLARLTDGGAVVAWQGLHQGVTAIYAQRIAAAGGLLWTGVNSLEVAVSSGGVRPAAPHLTIDGRSVSTIAWTDERWHNPDVFMQALDAAGQHFWPEDVALSHPDDVYQPVGRAESRTIDATALPIQQATLTADVALQGGAVDFELTNDGINWQPVQLGTRMIFTTTGSDLRWRVQLQANRHDPAESPTIRGVQIAYDTAVPLPDHDLYEPDNGCATAHALQVNGPAQQHALTAQANKPVDEDWVRFAVQAGERYVVWAAPDERTAALQVEVYPACGATVLATAQAIPGQSAILQWTAATTSTHFVRVLATDHHASALVQSPSHSYQLGARTVSSNGLAILVAGRLPADGPNQQAIDQSADRVYQTLQQHGYGAERLSYLGRQTGVTIQALQSAIQDWAASQPAVNPPGSAQPLLLYLAGQGATGRLYLNPTESITPEQLDLWLTNLEDHAAIGPIVIVLEASHAGSFIPSQQDGTDVGTLAAPNRIIVTATSAQGSVWRTSQGLLFSELFWSGLASGHPVQASFQRARQAVAEAGYLCQPTAGQTASWCQAPLLNDTGQTAELAYSQGLATPSSWQGPQILTVTTAWDATKHTVWIEAQLVVSTTETQVEAHLLPAPFQPTVSEQEPFPALQHPIVALHRVETEALNSNRQVQRYQGVYQAPTDQAGFWVSVHAWEPTGQVAVPFGLPVQTGFFTYLPLVSR